VISPHRILQLACIDGIVGHGRLANDASASLCSNTQALLTYDF
jgi:hypothetical protein